MLLITLSLSVILLIIALAPQTEGTEAPKEIISSDTSKFVCEELTENSQLPPGWDWTAVADKLNTRGCFERIAGNWSLYIKDAHKRQLFKVARDRQDDIVQTGHFCVLAKEMVRDALLEDLPTLKVCKEIDRNMYPFPLIVALLQEANYSFVEAGIDFKNFDWMYFTFTEEIDPELEQRFWLALVAVLHDAADESEESNRLGLFHHYIIKKHGINMDPSTPLTELDTQIIRLFPVAIEYILTRSAMKINMEAYVESTKDLYKSLHKKVANNQALSLYLHSRFFLNPAVDLPKLEKLQLPPINDIQMTKELFDYGNNLSKISDPTDREVATVARRQLEALLFPPSE